MSKLPEPPTREITPEALYRRRREFLRDAAAFVTVGAAWGTGLVALSGRGHADPPKRPNVPLGGAWHPSLRGRFSTNEAKTPYEAVTTYNNYYELGLSKSAPAENAYTLKPRPWTVRVTGHLKQELVLDIDQLLEWFPPEERVYRMRCVEAWSMVIPWLGFPLADFVRRVEPTSAAKFVRFTTLMDPVQLPGQDNPVLKWPYVEGLRIDEAMNPLAFLAIGLYGVPLLGQNGAPLRLVVPWKYGFKGAKSLVEIAFTSERPETTWNHAAPSEYGFHANVNPRVDHPRWSQATERRIGEFERRKTLPFNGYADQVAGLYSGLDLAENF